MKKDNCKKLAKIKLKRFQRNGVVIKVKELSAENGRLRIVVGARKDGDKIEVDNPLYYVNPPLKVATGKKRKVKDRFDNEIEVNEFREDHKEALKEIIYQTVWQR